MRLSVSDAQSSYVAPNSVSIAEAAYAEDAWLRAIYAGDDPVGLALLAQRPGRYYLWRFMVDHEQQGNGYGRRAMELVIDYVRSRPDGEDLYLSFVPGPDGPEGFYRSFGFETTGVEHGGELEMRLSL